MRYWNWQWDAEERIKGVALFLAMRACQRGSTESRKSVGKQNSRVFWEHAFAHLLKYNCNDLFSNAIKVPRTVLLSMFTIRKITFYLAWNSYLSIFLLRVLLVVWVELSHTPETEIVHLPQSCAVTQPSHLTHLVAYLLKTQHKWYQKAHTFKYLLNISMGLQI